MYKKVGDLRTIINWSKVRRSHRLCSYMYNNNNVYIVYTSNNNSTPITIKYKFYKILISVFLNNTCYKMHLRYLHCDGKV